MLHSISWGYVLDTLLPRILARHKFVSLSRDQIPQHTKNGTKMKVRFLEILIASIENSLNIPPVIENRDADICGLIVPRIHNIDRQH